MDIFLFAILETFCIGIGFLICKLFGIDNLIVKSVIFAVVAFVGFLI